jgi:hypothetical protein
MNYYSDLTWTSVLEPIDRKLRPDTARGLHSRSGWNLSLHFEYTF